MAKKTKTNQIPHKIRVQLSLPTDALNRLAEMTKKSKCTVPKAVETAVERYFRLRDKLIAGNALSDQDINQFLYGE